MEPSQHCLRPTFTARLAADLDRGAAINLVAGPGQGAGRLLDDLRRLPGRGPRLAANLKRYRANLAALIGELWDQTGLTGEVPSSLPRLCDRLERDCPGAALLLHRFDALLDHSDLHAAYGDGFIDTLDGLRYRGLSLVCVSAVRLEPYVVLTAGRVRKGTILELNGEDLPTLAWAEVAAEVDRRRPPLDEAGHARLVAAVLANPAPLDLLYLACQRLREGADASLTLRRRLKRWERELRQDPPRRGSAVTPHVPVDPRRRIGGPARRLPLAGLGAWVSGLFAGGEGKG